MSSSEKSLREKQSRLRGEGSGGSCLGKWSGDPLDKVTLSRGITMTTTPGRCGDPGVPLIHVGLQI